MATITWDEALEEICDKFTKIEQQYGSKQSGHIITRGLWGL